MTGVGKTSVVARLVELLSCQPQFFRFDLGDKDSAFSFYESVTELSKQDDETPLIVALDEFQHTRTVDEIGRERESDRNRMVWELMDSGKLRSYSWDRGVDNLDALCRRLESLLEKGVKVANGRIIAGIRHAWRDLELDPSLADNEPGMIEPASQPSKKIGGRAPRQDGENRLPRFVAEGYFEQILDAAGTKLGIQLEVDLEEKLSRMDGAETIAFLKRVVKIGKTPKEKKFSRLLVIVMGNLDEAFQMSGNFNADIDPDVFCRHTREIGITHIKSVLKQRFRNEQIARLGNLHIIYHGISRASFERVIARELDKIATAVAGKLDIRVEFDASINHLIYREGVFPTQGFRPIFSTIHQLISGNLGLFLAFPEVWNQGIDCLRLSEGGQRLRCTFLAAGEERFSAFQAVPTPLSIRRRPRYDDKQAVVAVHETGHAILEMVLLRTMPESVVSVTCDNRSGGFVVHQQDESRKIFPRSEIIAEAAVHLGGYAAEKLVFGNDRITAGSEEDISRATGLVSDLFKSNGMGSSVAHYTHPSVQHNNSLHQVEIEGEIKVQLVAALALAEESLSRERLLLLEIADHLSDNPKLTGPELREFVRLYASSDLLSGIEARKAGTDHRLTLKQKVAEAERLADGARLVASAPGFPDDGAAPEASSADRCEPSLLNWACPSQAGESRCGR